MIDQCRLMSCRSVRHIAQRLAKPVGVDTKIAASIARVLFVPSVSPNRMLYSSWKSHFRYLPLKYYLRNLFWHHTLRLFFLRGIICRSRISITVLDFFIETLRDGLFHKCTPL